MRSTAWDLGVWHFAWHDYGIGLDTRGGRRHVDLLLWGPRVLREPGPARPRTIRFGGDGRATHP